MQIDAGEGVEDLGPELAASFRDVGVGDESDSHAALASSERREILAGWQRRCYETGVASALR